MTPSLFSPLAAEERFQKGEVETLRLLVLGGEAIRVEDVEKALSANSNLRVMNHYGPTEATIGCIARFIRADELEDYRSRPTIGKPIFNMAVYILDPWSNPVPVGTPRRTLRRRLRRGKWLLPAA